MRYPTRWCLSRYPTLFLPKIWVLKQSEYFGGWSFWMILFGRKLSLLLESHNFWLSDKCVGRRGRLQKRRKKSSVTIHKWCGSHRWPLDTKNSDHCNGQADSSWCCYHYHCLLLSPCVIFHWNSKLRELFIFVVCARGSGCLFYFVWRFCFRFGRPLFLWLFGIHCLCNAVSAKATNATLVSLGTPAGEETVEGGWWGRGRIWRHPTKWYGRTGSPTKWEALPTFLIYIPLCPSHPLDMSYPLTTDHLSGDWR